MVKSLSFSYSKMGMYKECPQKYKFRYIHQIPELPKYYFAFGSALHAVMEFIYNPQREFFPSLAEALAFFDREWNKTTFEQKGYPSVTEELAGYAEGRHELEAYYAKHAANFVKPLSVEMRSTLEIDGLNLISILDRMDYLGDGQVKILDYKTGKTVKREPDQLYLYQKVVETSPVIKALVQQKDPTVKTVRVGALAFYHLPSLTELTFERAPDKEIFEFWQKVLTVADQIRAGKFTPTPAEKQCRRCDYRNICPVFTGKEYTGPSGEAALPLLKGETFAPAAPLEKVEKPISAASTQDILTEKIDRYGQLLQETQALKKEIVSLMQAQHFTHHFATQYKAQLLTQEKTVFQEKEKVVAFLQKHQLLGKTLVPTQSTIAALLADPSVPKALQDELAKLAQVDIHTDLQIEKTE